MEQRQCVVLFGERTWCDHSTRLLLSDFNDEQLLCLSDDPIADFQTLKIKQAKTQLGREFDAVVFDGLLNLFPDNIGQSVGTLNAGGVFILWLAVDEGGLYSQRFRRVVDKYGSQYASFHCVYQGKSLPDLTLPVPVKYDVAYRTQGQVQAVAAILKVVEGHRRRPLVLSADRGRGKSATLGLAAAQLLFNSSRHIIVTAPNLAAVEPVFKHAALALNNAKQSPGLIQFGDAELRFIAPDALLEGHYQADLLLVDEAAVIPSAMLAEMLGRFSRLVFATTLHGYEGTGRGFAVRFQTLLTTQSPEWRHYEMTEPVRWRSDDALEAFSFEALLLDAEPVDDRLIVTADSEQCSIEPLDKSTLVVDEVQLRQLFGLMVLAHYRTRPSDLQLLLDSDDISVYVVRYQCHIVASIWLVGEGSLSSELSDAVYRGERRLKGHLLPQSLLSHAGLLSAGTLNYQRVLRLAVHPVLQRQGLAKLLVAKVAEITLVQQIDVLGTSFSADTEVMSFWRDSGFTVVRVGTHRDEVSGQYSVTLLQACSAEGVRLVASAKKRFEQQWTDLLAMQFNRLDIKIVLAISTQFEDQGRVLSSIDEQDVLRFAQGSATYESCQVAIRIFVSLMLGNAGFLMLSKAHQQLLVMRVLQIRSVTDVAVALGLKGKSEVSSALRQSLSDLLIQFAAKDHVVIALE